MILAIVTAALILLAANLRTADEETYSGEARVTFLLAGGGELEIPCEVADTSYERSLGLQGREDLPIGKGMLFVYDDADERSFLMHNMHFPLDIIFIAENRTVLNVEEAEPEEPDTPNEDLVRYRSDGKAKWVVEINQGLSEKYGIGPGTQVSITIDQPSPPS
jgi:uncharacterized membrane protein (UPF0127 family)